MKNLFLDDLEIETNGEEESSDDSDVSENQDPIEPSSSNTFVAKDGTVWNQLPPNFHQTSTHNIVRQRSGPLRSTETMSVCDTFKCIFTNEMIDIIIRHTNKKAKHVYETYNTNNPTKTQLEWKDLTVREFNSFLGILITCGVNHSNTQFSLDMWKTNSYPLYRASMGHNRFRSILRFIRFDDANTREERHQIDKAAPIRDLWSMLNSNLRKYYRPTENLTIDEQLFPYRGRMKFKQYIPSKPAKYGIKIWWICDAENYYPLTGQIYTGKSSTGREVNQGERVVKELVAPYKGSGRNITTDNFFTTLPLAKHLLSWNLTIVGTLKKNKSYIPQEMAPSNSRQVFSTVYGFQNNVTICSYVPKKKKAVILLSTMHHTIATSGEKEKPEIVHFYNKTKSGVDVMDHLLGQYSTQRKTNRWPLALFYNIVDIAALAAYLVYTANNYMIKKRSNARSIFLRQLGEELSLPMIQDRSQNIQVMRHFSSRTGIECMLQKSTVIADETAVASTSRVAEKDKTGRKKVVGSCYICYNKQIRKRRKTRKNCAECCKPICNEHCKMISKCNICYEKE